MGEIVLRGCPVCGSGSLEFRLESQGFAVVKCRVCGEFDISAELTKFPGIATRPNSYILSGLIRQASEKEQWRSIPTITADNIDSLMDESHLPAGGLLGRMDLILEHFARRSPEFGGKVGIQPKYDYPLAFAHSPQEFSHMLGTLEGKGLIDVESRGVSALADSEERWALTVTGWERVDEIRGRPPAASRQCFVAMWFDQQMKQSYDEGFYPAIRAAGYEPLRIDGKEHNGKIDDQIVAEIRRSRLVVADFTGVRGGVYFEAGFAMGLGIPVIWTCRKNWKKKLHFDTRQYNHVIWETPEELREQLEKRIRATHPLQPTGAA